VTIALITDGMLYPIYKTITAPSGGEGIIGPIPVPPCDPQASDPAHTPPKVPIQTMARGPATPVVPCGPRGYDPTIDPPRVPRAPEAGETSGAEAPATPRCPQGRKT